MCKGISGMAQLTEGGVSMERLTKRVDGSLVFPSELIGIMMTPSNDAMYQILTRLAAYEDTGPEPEDLKKAFNETAILKLAAQVLRTTPDHLRDLLQAEQDGRLVVLPFMLHSTMLNLSDPENLEVMKDVSLYVAWKSSSGIVFHSPYNCFLQDIEKGYIKADSEEAEAALKGGEG